MPKAREPARSFADRVDQLVHAKRNPDIPIPPLQRPDVIDLANGIALLHDLLDFHKRMLASDNRVKDEGLLSALRLLSDLQTGRRGPIWSYVDSVRDTRHNKTPDDHLTETFQAMMVGLVQALETKFIGSKRNMRRHFQELVAEECRELTQNRIL